MNTKKHDERTVKEGEEECCPDFALLKEQLAEKDARIADYADHLKRLQAEFENYCKRVDRERCDMQTIASERLVVKLLGVIDDFERALSSIKDISPDARKGIELIFKNLHKILDEENVEKIAAVGLHFDPYKHEVVLQVDSSEPEGTVLEELQSGYSMSGKVVRYAKVKVSKGRINGGNE